MVTWRRAGKRWPRCSARFLRSKRKNRNKPTKTVPGMAQLWKGEVLVRTKLPVSGAAAETDRALELICRGVDLVQHLDPSGIGARDLRECLMIQIAAQQQEFSHIYSRQQHK